MLKGTNATTPKIFTGVQVQTSAAGIPISIIFGQSKQSPNLIWAGDFRKQPVKQGKGGKGGAKGFGQVYHYHAAVALAIGEGPIGGIGQVWTNGQLTTLSKLGLTLFTGTGFQTPWPYLTTNHPTEALAYRFTAYLAADTYDLGSSATLPNHEFEVIGRLVGTMPGTVDVNYADVITDMFTRPQYNFGGLTLDATSQAQYKTYCQAQGLWFSPALTDANQSLFDLINNWAVLSNSWIFWSGDSVKFVPLGDTPITANGVTYTPDLTVQYDLTSKDFIPQQSGGPPIEVTQRNPNDLPNHVKLEVLDRTNAYATATVEWQEPALFAAFGNVDASVSNAHDICDLAVANIVKALIGQRGAYIRNNYKFQLGYELGALEPGDVVTIMDPLSGIPAPRSVRITDMDEDGTDVWTVAAEDFLLGIGTVTPTAETPNGGLVLNRLVDPGNVNPPGIFEPTSDLTNGIAQLWLAASGGPEWGGCAIMLSFDDAEYVNIGLITEPAWQGTLLSALPSHADPDNTNTLQVDLAASAGVMTTAATHADADAKRTLMLLTPSFSTVCAALGELASYGNVVQGATQNQFNISYLRRALYGSAAATHAIGGFFTRFDLSGIGQFQSSMLTYDLPAAYIGQTLYLKFLSFNRYGESLQDISTVTRYTYLPIGLGYGTGTGGVPSAPTGFFGSGAPAAAALNWSANPAPDGVRIYQVWGAPGTSVAFGSCMMLFSGNVLGTSINGLLPNSAYTFYLVAVNAVGSSLPSAAVNVTTGAATGGLNFRAVTVGSSPFTLDNSDNYVDVTNATGAPLEIRMPPGPASMQKVIVTDAGGTAGTNAFSLKTNNGVTLLGSIGFDGSYSTLRWTGSNWRLSQ